MPRTPPPDGYCVVVYDGKTAGVPEHLRSRFVIQGVEFASGEEVTVAATGAHLMMQPGVAPAPGAVKVVAGTPAPYKVQRPYNRTQAGAAHDFTDAFHPARD